MKNSYAMAKMPEMHAKAMGRDVPVSTKHCIEICSYIRGKKVARAKKLLQDAIDQKAAIPFKKAVRDLGHKKGIGPGRYPKKASEAVLKLLNDVEANAAVKGLGTNDLVIKHIVANKASKPWHYGRIGRIKMKRTHIEVVVAEMKEEAKTRKQDKSGKANNQEVKA